MANAAPVGVQRVAVNFDGPFSWIDSGGLPCMFDHPIGAKAGIYLWTVGTPEGELIYYVGETGRSFAGRLFEHLKEHLAGAYHVWEPEPLGRGVKVELWAGIYGRNRREATRGLVEKHESLAGAISGLISVYRFFVAPLDCDQRTRQRIEAGIALYLYGLGDAPTNFQDRGIRYLPRYAGELPITLDIDSARLLRGLPDSLEV